MDFLINGYIGENLATDIVQATSEIPPEEEIRFKINSSGGDVSAGLAAANIIENLPNPTIAENIGEVISAATLVFLAADEWEFSESSTFMFHRVWMLSVGNMHQIKHDADILNIYDEAVAKYVSSRVNKKSEKYLDLLDKAPEGELWLNAEDFIDLFERDKNPQNTKEKE